MVVEVKVVVMEGKGGVVLALDVVVLAGVMLCECKDFVHGLKGGPCCRGVYVKKVCSDGILPCQGEQVSVCVLWVGFSQAMGKRVVGR